MSQFHIRNREIFEAIPCLLRAEARGARGDSGICAAGQTAPAEWGHKTQAGCTGAMGASMFMIRRIAGVFIGPGQIRRPAAPVLPCRCR